MLFLCIIKFLFILLLWKPLSLSAMQTLRYVPWRRRLLQAYLLNDKTEKGRQHQDMLEAFSTSHRTPSTIYFHFYRRAFFPFATLYRNKCDKLLSSVLLTRTTHSWIDDLFLLYFQRHSTKTVRNWKFQLLSLKLNWHETWNAASTNSRKLSSTESWLKHFKSIFVYFIF